MQFFIKVSSIFMSLLNYKIFSVLLSLFLAFLLSLFFASLFFNLSIL